MVKIMNITKLKFAVASTMVAVVAVTPWAVRHQALNRPRHENRSLRRQLDAGAETGVSTASSKSAPLYFRTIKVNPDTVVSKVKEYTRPVDANTDPAPFRKAALRQLLLDHGIDIKPPEAVSLDENEGKVLAYSSLQTLDKLEKLIKSWSDSDKTASPGAALDSIAR
jgi:hypothetical protein